MTTKLPTDGTGSVDWTQPPPQKPEKILTSPKRDVPKPVPEPPKQSKKLGTVKAAVAVESEQIEKVASLHKSIREVKLQSAEHPLIPHNPKGADNANDVYMVNFEHSEKPEKDDKADIVVKPGVQAATNGKICFLMGQSFEWMKNVIVPTNHIQASVISREDYQVDRTRVYCPAVDCEYLIDTKDVKNKFQIDKPKENSDGSITGKLKNKQVTLEPIENFPGFYHLKGGGLDFEVMQISTLHPTPIDTWVIGEADWMIATDGKESFLVPNEEMIQIEQAKKSSKKPDVSEDTSEDTSDITSSFEDSNEKPVKISETKKEDLPVAEYKEQYVTIGKNDYSLDVEKGNISLYPVGDQLNSLIDDPKEIASRYRLLSYENSDGEIIECLVPKTALLPWNETGEDFVNFKGKDYEVEYGDGDGTFIVKDAGNEGEIFYIKVDAEEDNYYDDQIIYTKHGQDYVKRNDQDYQVITEKGNKAKVVGKNINGMAQLKVKNIFTKPVGSKQALDVLARSRTDEDVKNREEFYSRIDMPSFIQAFIASLLLRSEDGKIIDLDSSNVLFQVMPNSKGIIDPSDPESKLCPIIIDLDETMPRKNDFIVDDQYPENSVVAERFGVNGLPQAHKVLTGNDKVLAKAYLEEIVNKEDFICELLQRFVGKGNWSFTQENVNAYKEVVDRIGQFLEMNQGNDWSLQQLCFFVFPEYEKQWKALGDIPPEYKAMYIGNVPVDKALKEYYKK